MESLGPYLKSLITELFGKQYSWMIEVFIVVFLTLLLVYYVSVFTRSIQKRAEKTKTLWDDALVNAIRRPMKWLIMLIGLSISADIAAIHASSIILNSVDSIRYLGIIFIVTWFIVGFIAQAEKNFINPEYCRKPVDQTTARAIGKLLRISVIITAVLIVLQYFDVEISGILAFGGIGGIAVGFAAKDLLANFFGGAMIYLDRPFAVGDWVRSNDRDIEGTVEDIGWRLTRIRTFDKRPLYVPNSTFTQIAVENPSRMTNRRIYETIGVRYDDVSKMEEIVADVKEMLKNHPAIDTSQTLMVNFNTFASSSLDFFVYCFTKTCDWALFHEQKQDVLLNIIKIIEAHGAECAFPTSTIHLTNAANFETKHVLPSYATKIEEKK